MEMNFKTTGIKGPKTKRFIRVKDYLQTSKTYIKMKISSEEENVESFSEKEEEDFTEYKIRNLRKISSDPDIPSTSAS